ncbi:response regulator [Pseudomonas sp. WHRI 8822A]|uniref:response regulator n=1 Tax=Pseudomonas sp. WHRI 8822A TaxID=3162568 RepID=UPI0032EEF056
MSSSILLVEDESLDLELALIALKRARMDSKLTVVRDGQQAMDYLFCQNRYASREPGNPALVILDLKTPNLTGLQILEAMRGCVDLRDIPVVVMTNSRDPMVQQKARELNVSAYIVKPLALEDYVEAVASLSTLLAPDGSPSKPQTKPHWR